VHTSAKTRLTSVAIRIRIVTKMWPYVHCPIAKLLWKFHANPFRGFFAQSCYQTNRQTNNDDYISSLAEVISLQAGWTGSLSLIFKPYLSDIGRHYSW